MDGSGVIDSADTQILARNYGFAANLGPQPNPALATLLTHVDLVLRIPLDSAVIDPDGDRVVYQLVGVDHGTATLSADGRFVLFVPTTGYDGPASVSVTGDDGFSTSDLVLVDVTVSPAPLLRMDILHRQPSLDLGERSDLVVVGDFADQTGVPLIGSYVIYSSSNSAVLEVNATGNLRGAAEGYSTVTARRGNLAAATAVTVGAPNDPLGLGAGALSVYPQALALPLDGGQRQFLVNANSADLSGAASGTQYIVGDSSVVAITADGFASSVGLGATTITIINGAGEIVLPVRVILPPIGAALIDVTGGAIQATNGTTVQIAPGALAEGVTVSLTTIPSVVEPLFDSVFDVGTTFELSLGGAELSEPAQIMVPAGPGFSAGDTVYFFKKETITLPDGSTQDTWLLIESGKVGDDGRADDLASVPGLQRRRAVSTGQGRYARPACKHHSQQSVKLRCIIRLHTVRLHISIWCERADPVRLRSGRNHGSEIRAGPQGDSLRVSDADV